MTMMESEKSESLSSATTNTIIQDKLIDIKVGWGFPSKTINKLGNEDLLLNFHLKYLSDSIYWMEIIYYSDFIELYNNVKTFNETFLYANFLTVTDITQIQHDLLITHYHEPTITKLDRYLRSYETFINNILNNLPRIDEESRRICKQLFFSQTPEKVSLYETLNVISNLNRKDETSTRYSKVSKHTKSNKVLRTMAKLFQFSMTTKTSKLNSKNLSRLSKIQEGDEDIEEGEDEGEEGHHNPRYHVNDDIEDQQSRVDSLESATTTGTQARKGYFSGFSFLKTNKPHENNNNHYSYNQSSIKNNQYDSDKNNTGILSALDVANKSLLLSIEVMRGQEIQSGIVVYEINLKITGKKFKIPQLYTTFQRYSRFKKLYLTLNELSTKAAHNANQGSNNNNSPYSNFMLLINAPFPTLTLKSYLGFSLNDSELSQRTRMLESWLREICIHYRNMPTTARIAIREFLNFDMSRTKDIFFQDQLAWGTIESHGSNAPILIVQKGVLDSVPDQLLEEIETMSNAPMDSMKKKHQSLNKQRSQSKAIDAMTERSHLSGNAQLQNLIWETASVGGQSKLPATKATGSRNVYKAKEI